MKCPDCGTETKPYWEQPIYFPPPRKFYYCAACGKRWSSLNQVDTSAAELEERRRGMFEVDDIVRILTGERRGETGWITDIFPGARHWPIAVQFLTGDVWYGAAVELEMATECPLCRRALDV